MVTLTQETRIYDVELNNKFYMVGEYYEANSDSFSYIVGDEGEDITDTTPLGEEVLQYFDSEVD